MSWGTKIASETQRVLNAPVWYARRTVVADTAALLIEGTKYNFRSLSTQFEQGDKLMVIPFEGEQLAKEGSVVEITKRDMFDYELSAALPAGKVMLIKRFENWKPIDGKKGQYLIPITREMLAKDKAELRKIGIVSPGWYRWSQVFNEKGEVVHTRAYLSVSMKNFSVEGSADEGQFDTEGTQKFEPTDLANEAGEGVITLV